MAKWLDNLKTFAETNFHIDLSNFTFINVNIGQINKSKTGNVKPVSLDSKSQTLQIDVSKLSKDELTEFKKITSEYIDDGNYLLEEESADLLSKLYDFNKNSDYKKHLKFFKELIPKEDYKALEASYFMRKEHEEKADASIISRHKREIRDQFGQRGGHIANLCTAGYFEELLIPVYNYDSKSFQDWYKLVVEQGALTLFIHAGMKNTDIVSTLKNKTELAKKYGLNSFYVHSKGSRNIKTIRKCLTKFETTYQAIPKVERHIESLDVIIIQFILK